MTDAGPDDKILRIIMQYVTDQGSLQGGVAGARQMASAIGQVTSQAKTAETQLHSLRRAAGELSQIGSTMAIAGAAIAGPFIAAAKAYVDANKQTDVTARSWSDSMDKIQANYMRVGKIALQDMNPAIQKAADLTDKLAAFLEKNPDIVRAALGIGGAVGAAGVSVAAAGNVARSVIDIGLLVTQLSKIPAIGSFLGGLGAAPGVALTVAGSALGATAGGIGIGGLAYDAYARKTGGTNLGQFASVGAYAAGSIFGQHTADEWFTAMSGLTHATDANTQTTLQNSIAIRTSGINSSGGAGLDNQRYGPFLPTLGASAYRPQYQMADNVSMHAQRFAAQAATDAQRNQAIQQGIPAFQQYQSGLNTLGNSRDDQNTALNVSFVRATSQQDQDHHKTLLRQQRDYNEQTQQMQSDFDKNRLTELRDFNANEATIDKNSQEQLASAQEAHDKDVLRSAQDHAVAMEKMAQDHEGRLRDFAAAGDALGFVKEQQQFAKDKEAADKQYNIETQRRDADYAQSVADFKKQAEEQRADRLKNFQQQQDDEKKAFDDSNRLRDQQHQQQLADQDADWQELVQQRNMQFKEQKQAIADNYEKQKTQLTTAFTDQLNAIDPILTGMTTLVQQKMQDASDEFSKFLEGVKNEVKGGDGYCGPGYHWDDTIRACVVNTHKGVNGMAAGGYAATGIHMLSEGGRTEFVMNGMVTQMATQALGPLNQQVVMNALARGGGTTVNIGGINVPGGLGSREDWRKMVDYVDGRLVDAFDQFRDAVRTV